MSTSRKPRRSSSSRTISTPMPPHPSTKPFPPPRPGVWSSASNGITRQSTVLGSTWPNPNSAPSRHNVSTAESPTRRQSLTRSPPGFASETKITPAPNGTSQPTTPASNSEAYTLQHERIEPLGPSCLPASPWPEAGSTNLSQGGSSTSPKLRG